MEDNMDSPPSPRSDGSVSPLTAEGHSASPEPEAEAAADAPGDQDEQQDGMKSPESERLADDLLREPFQAGGQLHLQLVVPPPATTVEEPATPTAAVGPYTSSCDNLALAHHASHPAHAHRNDAAAAAAALAAAAAFAASPDGSGAGSSDTSSVGGAGASALCGWSFERHRERMRLRAACRLSGEGALEGFQDPQDLLLADAAAPGASARIGDDAGGSDDAGGGVSLGWEALLSGFYADLVREWEDVRCLLSTSAAALWEKVRDGRMAVEEALLTAGAAARKAAKAAGRSGCPLWALLGVSGLAAVCLAALAGQVCANRRLSSQLRQRDRDLARLVVKILNLQDALHSAARSAVPMLRHTSCERFTTTTTLIGMV
ncbi:hypothetical protein GPECTOR_12g600 [Gonium pectorale]|uniref:Uncharacterized protein n=1 Tax=Gonium pectorale TaxID=33097 RepID=A0A150GP47_GONPE|nr:hypothetical protein GPECTOR_12g600 [Gonium pectorale]|eukprot:KXZ51636.1 hypothetical protein GPECTOR_12g600 [Gonium pectorale]